jgi:Ala-tRNA(Pro) deacylase
VGVDAVGVDIVKEDTFERIVALLTEAKANFRVIEHEAEGRSEKISVIPRQPARPGGQGDGARRARRWRRRRHVLAILPGNSKLDFAASPPCSRRANAASPRPTRRRS